MAHKHGSSYPSPTAAQTGNGAGPYPGRHAEADPDELDLGAQLRHEMNNASGHNEHNLQQAHQRQPDPSVYHQMYGTPVFPQMPMQSAQLGPPQTQVQAQVQAPSTVPLAPPHNVSAHEEVPGKKKSKASRACDECRRKKIKCDADSDNPNAGPCSNCRRTNSENCRFSRTPMKRGPSKGYIKELSDRVANLEQERQRTGVSSSQASPTALGELNQFGRKRTHSMSENQSQQQLPTSHQSTMAPVTGGPWTSSTLQHLTQAQPPIPNMPFPEDAAANGLPPVTGSEEGPVTFTDDEEGMLDQYYEQTYKTLPLLPLKHELTHLFIVVPGILRSAFFFALSAVNTPLFGENSRVEVCKSAYQALCFSVGYNVAQREFIINLVYLQSIILLIIAVEVNGHPSEQPHGVPPVRHLVGMALEIIAYYDIGDRGIDIKKHPEAAIWQPTVRRTRAIFRVFLEWSAIGKMDLQDNLPSVAYKPSVSDRDVLGTKFYLFTRISYLTETMKESAFRFMTADGSNTWLNNVNFLRDLRVDNYTLDLVHELIEGFPDSNLATVAYWHLKTWLIRWGCIGMLLTPPKDLIHAVHQVVMYLPDTPSFALSHHFAVLAVQTLMDLTAFNESKSEAVEGLKRLAQTLEGENWQESGWTAPLLKKIQDKLETLGGNDTLQHLADTAIREGEPGRTEDAPSAEEQGIDWSSVVTEGYLEHFART